MKKTYLHLKKGIFLTGLIGASVASFAQQRIIGTVRTRSEYRDGLGNLPVYGGAGTGAVYTPNSDAGMFTSQRTNLLYGYKWTKLDFQVQLRDVRVWGQDASTISNSDGNKLFLHEAWGEFTIATAADTNCWLKVDNLALKVGRQEIVYDDVRLLGNLDWLQQGRRHDAAILKFLHRGYQLDLGAAFNQNADGFGTRGVFYNPQNSTAAMTAHKSGMGYTVPLATPANAAAPVAGTVGPAGTNAIGQMYKSMQFLYGSRKWGQTKVSALVFKDDFAKYADTASNRTARYYYTDKQVNSRWTMGVNFSTQFGNASGFGKIAVSGGGFTQRGNDKAGNDMGAYMANLAVTYQKGKFQFGPAFDYLSGNSYLDDVEANKKDANGKAIGNVNGGYTTNKGFDPLYGTPHRWWGYMDYFYVGTGAPRGGLLNYQLRAKYTANRYFVTIDYHNFQSDGSLAKNVTKDLGHEIDIVVNYNINKFTNIEVGYCKYFGATEGTQFAKGQTVSRTTSGVTYVEANPNVRKEANWAYAMITIRPDFLFVPPVAINASTLTPEQASQKIKDMQEQIDALKQKVDPTPAEAPVEETK
jgi:hypothetical protein